tara:strand:- start:4471 stop:5652 length:1182 start_codon:yes stop_codon:yes gene_type:complete
MSTIINSRSPYYFKVSEASLNSATVEIYIWTGLYSARVVGDLKYTLSKQEVGDTNYVVFEVSELVRDFLETEYGNYSTDTIWADIDTTIYDSSGAIVQVGGQDTVTTPFLVLDGYGYFEENSNPRTSTDPTASSYTPQVLQNNLNVYFNSGQDIKIPVFAEAQSYVTLTSAGGANINWDDADEFWDTYDANWGAGTTPIQIVDSGNSDQKIQYVILTDTENLQTGDKVTFVSPAPTATPTQTTVINLISVAEAKYTPLNIIFYNKYGALQNMWFFKKSTNSINVTSEKYKSNILDLDNSGGVPSYVINKHQEKTFMVNSRESISVSTDFINEEYNEVIRQLLNSEQVWVDDGTNVLPINLKSKSFELKKGVNDRFVNYTISFDYAFDKINNIL